MEDRERLIDRLCTLPNRRLKLLLFSLFAVMTTFAVPMDSMGQAKWIWSPRQKATDSGVQDCFFRKKFSLIRPEKTELYLAAGDRYTLYVNGVLASQGESFGSVQKLDISSFLKPGVNLMAVKVTHSGSDNLGLASRLRVLESGESRWRSLVSNEGWKTRIQEVQGWKSPSYNDMGWLKARTSEIAMALYPERPTNSNRPNSPTNQSSSQVANSSNTNSSTSSAVLESATGQPTPGQPTPVSPSTTNVIADTTTLPTPTTASVEPRNATSSQQQTPVASTTVPAAQAKFSNPTPPESKPKNVAEVTTATPIKPTDKATSQIAAKPAATSTRNRFTISDEFSIEQIMLPEETGSLVAMAFNEFNKLILSREGGPLLMADLTRKPNDPERIKVICDQLNTCQGILPLNGELFVTGMGPQGLGLYRLADKNQDGQYEPVQTLIKFKGRLGEHGPHGLTLGDDGMIYVVIGNASGLEGQASTTSPFKNTYEGDLVKRYEDPAGHAAGVKAPGGTIVRVSIDGSKVETVAGGLRNAYDLVFDRQGDLFIHDSDMESDMGMSWYRPTKLFQVTDGAELGWRSGWSKFPEYFADQTPSVLDTGRGSPTGAVLYQHLQFPARYHGAMFFADWSEGRILAVRTEANGAGSKANVEEFLKGKPMNVVDLEVGEDGSLYFCVGGRGTEGGVFRVVWNGNIPEKLLDFGDNIARVIRHPQPSAAWARQNIAKLRQEIGDEWKAALIGVATQADNPTDYRIRALNNMVLYGPFPDGNLLSRLAVDSENDVRAKVAKLCGLNNSTAHRELLAQLLKDTAARVRRVACESCMRIGYQPSFNQLAPLLASTDRIESGTARRLLETIPVAEWEEQATKTSQTRVFIQSALAMMIADPTLERAYSVLARTSEFMDGFLNDRDFTDLLRVTQVALFQGKIQPEKVPAFASRMQREFPSSNGPINCELARIIAYLKTGGFEGRLTNYFETSDDTKTEKLHVAMHLQTIGNQLELNEQLTLIDFLETSIQDQTGGSFALFVQSAIKDLTGTVPTDQISKILDNGDRWPNAMISSFYKLPEKMEADSLTAIIAADRRAAEDGSENTKQIRLGIIAMLARNGDQTSMEYLRECWRNEPGRRSDIAIGLAQQAEGENWPYLVSSIPVLDDLTAVEVINKLTEVKLRPQDAEHFRNVIQTGFRLRTSGAQKAASLLEHWAGETVSNSEEDWMTSMNRWKAWFEKRWPEEAKIEMESDSVIGKYKLHDVLSYVETSASGDASKGATVFAKAQCANCHRFGAVGVALGPDLTSIANRFSQRELAESIIHPSKVVSDQYRAKTVLTVDGVTLTGMTMTEPDGALVVVQSDGKRIRVAPGDVEGVKETEVSSMPENLMDQLTLQEIADLFAYLKRGGSQQATNTNDDQTFERR